MKGSTKFWIAILISIIIYGIYLLISNWHTFSYDNKKIIIVLSVGILSIWEAITGTYRADEEVDFKLREIHWYSLSLIWGVYVSLKYYLNPFLDKILKD